MKYSNLPRFNEFPKFAKSWRRPKNIDFQAMAIPRYLRRALQLGLEGLILPMAESAAQAPISGPIFGAVDPVVDHLASGYLLHSHG